MLLTRMAIRYSRHGRTEMCAVSWQTRHRSQELLYEAVTDYVREGYNQATREKRNYVDSSWCCCSACGFQHKRHPCNFGEETGGAPRS